MKILNYSLALNKLWYITISYFYWWCINISNVILVGLVLGDSWLLKQKVNARFRFEQSHIRTDFFFYVFWFFSFFSPNTPKLRERFFNVLVKLIILVIFILLAQWAHRVRWPLSGLPYFTYYDLFYVNGVKLIPANIYDLLTPTALAFCIMSVLFFITKVLV